MSGFGESEGFVQYSWDPNSKEAFEWQEWTADKAVDWLNANMADFRELAWCQTSVRETFQTLGIRNLYTMRFIYANTNFEMLYEKFRNQGRLDLKRAQMRNAIVHNDTTMQKWLGKQYLGQSEKIEHVIEQKKLADQIPVIDEEEYSQLVEFEKTISDTKALPNGGTDAPDSTQTPNQPAGFEIILTHRTEDDDEAHSA